MLTEHTALTCIMHPQYEIQENSTALAWSNFPTVSKPASIEH